ncbi:MAG: addiction module protein [Acidimicrobiales bacterium]
MATAAESLLEKAMLLPAADRALLAYGLLASLDAEDADEATVDRAWSKETDRRARMLEAGAAHPVTWDDLIERVDALRSPRTGG